MLPEIADYSKLRASFVWNIPLFYNIGVDICDRWAKIDPQRPAIIEILPDGGQRVHTFSDLRARSNRMARVLRRKGVKRGDRVAILLPQMAEVAVAHFAIAKIGAIALPLASVFGVDALHYRLANAGAKAVITHAPGIAKLLELRPLLPGLHLILSTDGPDQRGHVLDLEAELAHETEEFTPEQTLADDPAMMIYPSGTTGQPKGALHGHRVVPGHVPGLQFSHEFFPKPLDLMWTPADWAWAGGLLNALLPSLHLGVAVVARKFDKFDPDEAFALMAHLKVRNAFIPPTALRMMRAVKTPRKTYELALRSIGSAGESLGAQTLLWGREALGLTINEFYGQTECNYVLGSCGALGIVRPGAIGKALPGHEIAVIRADGSTCQPDEPGIIAIRRPDPVMFLGYWQQEAATREKFIGDWMITGDQGRQDAEGYVQFFGRDDDIITSAGYRIGPGEIEDCLMRHPAVLIAAAIGKPDDMRTEIVKAFCVLREGTAESPELAADIRAFVRERLSAHEYPREISFVRDLPLTTSGKVIRRLLRQQA